MDRDQQHETMDALAVLIETERRTLLNRVLLATTDPAIEAMVTRLAEIRGLGKQSARELVAIIGWKTIEIEP